MNVYFILNGILLKYNSLTHKIQYYDTLLNQARFTQKCVIAFLILCFPPYTIDVFRYAMNKIDCLFKEL